MSKTHARPQFPQRVRELPCLNLHLPLIQADRNLEVAVLFYTGLLEQRARVNNVKALGRLVNIIDSLARNVLNLGQLLIEVHESMLEPQVVRLSLLQELKT